MPLRKAWNITKKTFVETFEDRVPKLAASLAYYTVFSLPGLLLVVIWISDLFYGRQAVEGTVYGRIANLVGGEAAAQIQQTIRNARMSTGSSWAAVIGIGTLVLGATGVFGEIQDSINQIWHLRSKPKKGRGILRIIINRLLSFSMVVTLGFLLLVSLILNSLMDILFGKLAERFPEVQVYVVYGFNFLLSLVVITILFGIIFKVLPDARIRWKDVRAGAIATALLFMAGRFLIGFYLGQGSMLATAYGAAGSVIVILLWVYYSAIILYFGAVFTRVYAVSRGCQIFPNEYAVWIEKKEVEYQSSLKEHADSTGDTEKLEEGLRAKDEG